MLEGFDLTDDLEAAIFHKDVAPRNDMNIDPLFHCFSPIEYSPKYRLKNPHNSGNE
jgi:hypothetical protein